VDPTVCGKYFVVAYACSTLSSSSMGVASLLSLASLASKDSSKSSKILNLKVAFAILAPSSLLLAKVPYLEL
jgi:hypothetical protein